jgi:predicted dehydrogenase
LNNSDILSVLIIGCGNIAGNLDYNKLNADLLPLTHAGAYAKHPYFSIQACIDVSQKKAETFASQWDIPNAYTSIDQAVQAGASFDVISICSPTGCHFEDVSASLALSPKLIFCEKPVTGRVKDTLKIKAACDQADVLLAVNYLRRWDERVLGLKKEIATNQRGSLRSVVGYYNKGILNNGSHLLDLLGFLVGEMSIKHVGQADYDFFSNDPSVCVTLEAGAAVPVLLVPGAKASDYSIFEIQMVFDNSMLLMLDGGLRWVERIAGDSDVFDGYRVLDPGVQSQGGYLAAMSHAVDNIWRTLTTGDPLNSDVDTALIAHILCENILAVCRR